MANFELASRKKFRFSSQAGLLTVEDLWDLPLQSKTKVSLDAIAIDLHTQMQQTSVSFVSSQTTDKTVEEKFAIVKHIIDVKVAERDAAAIRAKNSEMKQRILEVIAQKEDNELVNKDIDELRKLAESL